MLDPVRREIAGLADTAVIKIGTNVLTAERGGLDPERLADLAGQVAELKAAGRKLVLVSSGAIGAGLARLGLAKRPSHLPELQAAAAVGQSELMKAWDRVFAEQNLATAQILLTAADFDDRTRYLNARNTILQLLEWNVVPIINENDTVSVAEIRFGDNDQLAAMVTNLLRAPLLVILSVVDGLYDGDFDRPDARRLVDTVLDVDSVLSLAGSSTSGLGTGGMKSKLQAARIATLAGESVWVAGGRQPDVLRRIFVGERLGTVFPARGESMTAWKRWVGLTARPRGTYRVDGGAEAALRTTGRSLLPVGVLEVTGDFQAGDVVAVASEAGTVFARGLSNYSADEARRVVRCPSAKLAELLPAARFNEAIHRDNLVLI